MNDKDTYDAENATPLKTVRKNIHAIDRNSGANQSPLLGLHCSKFVETTTRNIIEIHRNGN